MLHFPAELLVLESSTSGYSAKSWTRDAQNCAIHRPTSSNIKLILSDILWNNLTGDRPITSHVQKTLTEW